MCTCVCEAVEFTHAAIRFDFMHNCFLRTMPRSAKSRLQLLQKHLYNTQTSVMHDLVRTMKKQGTIKTLVHWTSDAAYAARRWICQDDNAEDKKLTHYLFTILLRLREAAQEASLEMDAETSAMVVMVSSYVAKDARTQDLRTIAFACQKAWTSSAHT